MKLTCKDCGTTFDAADKETLEKLNADHHARFHDNKQEQIKQLAASAKSMAFQLVNGSVPKRKDARALVSLASQVLNEPIPDMPDDEKAPVSAGSETGGEQAQAGEKSGAAKATKK